VTRGDSALAPDERDDGTASLHASVADLIRLLESTLDGEASDTVPPDARALRRALRRAYRPEDEDRLASRFRGARLCLVSTTQPGAVRAGLAATPDVLVDTCDEGLVVLVPGLPRDTATADRITRTVTRMHRAAPTAAVGISTPLGHVRDASRGLDEATRALELCRPGAAVLADDRWFDLAISRLRESVRASLAAGGPLDRLDDSAKSGADLRATLTTWLVLDGDVRATAARLHLHPNSVRYRLQRAAQLTGIDLDDPLQRLVAHLALTSA
jgi:sugar diacid utilization regulator